MAILMDVVADDGTPYTDAYWTPVQVNICKSEHNGAVVFYAYRSEADYKAGRKPLGVQPKPYAITREEFDSLYPKILSKELSLFEAVYLVAARKDTLTPTKDDPNNMASFFASGRSDVISPTP